MILVNTRTLFANNLLPPSVLPHHDADEEMRQEVIGALPHMPQSMSMSMAPLWKYKYTCIRTHRNAILVFIMAFVLANIYLTMMNHTSINVKSLFGSHEIFTKVGAGFTFPPMIFGHIHMAKTAGTEINGALALRSERVCGNKGYSYDAVSFNQRAEKDLRGTSGHWTETLKTPDLISKVYKQYNRGRVPPSVMAEIGYHDCDWISFERRADAWSQLVTMIKLPLELHTPCREPISHLMSQCNFRNRRFKCMDSNLTEEVMKCMVFLNRFDDALGLHENITLKCFNPIPIEPYLNYIGQYLQPRRVRPLYAHRETNKPHNKTTECIWKSPESVKQEVLEIMRKLPYYRFCERCMGSKDDLLYLQSAKPEHYH
jgi:hypothetical protein